MSSYKRSVSSLSSFGTVGIFVTAVYVLYLVTFSFEFKLLRIPDVDTSPASASRARQQLDSPIYTSCPAPARTFARTPSLILKHHRNRSHHNLSSHLISHVTMAKNPCYALLWLILLVFIAWPVAGFASGLWIFLQPFEACFSFISDANSCLETYITWPRKCGAAIQSCSSSCPTP